MAIYRKVNGVVREIKHIYRNVGGVRREIKERYEMVNGVKRKVFSSDHYVIQNGKILDGRFKNLQLYTRPKVGNVEDDNYEFRTAVISEETNNRVKIGNNFSEYDYLYGLDYINKFNRDSKFFIGTNVPNLFPEYTDYYLNLEMDLPSIEYYSDYNNCHIQFCFVGGWFFSSVVMQKGSHTISPTNFSSSMKRICSEVTCLYGMNQIQANSIRPSTLKMYIKNLYFTKE